MSDIVVLGFEDEAAADAFKPKLERMQGEGVLALEDSVKVTVNSDGKAKLHQGFSSVRADAAIGGMLGVAVGVLFLNPLLGAAAGAAAGAAVGAFSGDYGIDDAFIKETSAALTPGSTALFLLVAKSVPEAIQAELQGTKATVLSTTLSPEAAAKLQEALADDATAG
ncbi:MAG: DUF1269 domain-containing protein [Coriobacteriia bacterium]|nr:DUF1269 domain-containing protein [Coriobacteriia bacterium]